MAANQRSRQTNSASTKKNITGKTSAGRKTTSTRKKTAGSRQQASRRNASSAQKNRRTSRMQVQDYDELIGDEIKLIVILAVSILVLLSVFGIGGRSFWCYGLCIAFSPFYRQCLSHLQSRQQPCTAQTWCSHCIFNDDHGTFCIIRSFF